MYGVRVFDADAVRRLIPNLNKLITQPYCAYLFVLARQVDHEAIEFLQRYWQAVHDETGEAIAVIVLYDDIRVVGYARGSRNLAPDVDEEQLPVVHVDRIAQGSFAVRTREMPRGATQAIFSASPRWSLKLADEIGLSRSFVPCIVGFDSGADDEADQFVVVDLSDADRGWQVIRDAIASFMELPESREFVVAIERRRRLKTQRFNLGTTVPETAAAIAQMQAQFMATVPRNPQELAQLLEKPSNPEHHRIITGMSEVLSRAATPEERNAATVLAIDVDQLRALLNHERCANRLSRRWIGADIVLGRAPAQVVKHLNEALLILGRNNSPAAIDEILTVDDSERQHIVEMVRSDGPARLAQISKALITIRSFRSPTQSELDRDYAETTARLAEVDQQIAEIHSSLTPVPFTPHLLRAIDNNPSNHTPGTDTQRWRKVAKRASGVAGFGANIAQILKSIGILH